MSRQPLDESTYRPQASLEKRLAAYVTAAAGAAVLSSELDAAIVANTTPQTIGINQEVNIDFNSDNHVDFQIDHDRYNLAGADLDYLQIDKNDASSAADPLPIENFQTFPAPTGVTLNGDHGYLEAQGAPFASFYPAALNAGDVIGFTPPDARNWGFQESANAIRQMNEYRRHNRLIDEDHGQIDESLGKLTLPPTDISEWVGLEGQTRYLGVRLDLNDSAAGFNALLDPPANDNYWYGWIGVQITNEADATGIITGWAYESTMNTPIAAGDTGPLVANADYDDDGDVDGGDFLVWQRASGSTVANGTGADGNGDGMVNAADLSLWQNQFAGAAVAESISGTPVPEPTSLLMAGLGLALLISCVVVKHGFRKLAPIRCR